MLESSRSAWVAMIRCPVEDMGKYSVMPSTVPRMIASVTDNSAAGWGPFEAGFSLATSAPKREDRTVIRSRIHQVRTPVAFNFR